MRTSLWAVLLLFGGGLLFGGELDDILGRSLSAKDKRDLASLTQNLENLEAEHRAQRLETSVSGLGGVAMDTQIQELSARIGTLVRNNLGKLDTQGWRRLREHLIRRYEKEFLPRAIIEEIEEALPAEARRRSLMASYSAVSFLKNAETQLPSFNWGNKTLIQHRERTLRLQAFSAEAPDFLFLVDSLRDRDYGRLGSEERKRLTRLLSAGRVFNSEDWRQLAAGDPLCASLIYDRFQTFAEGASVKAVKTAGVLGLPLGDYLRGTELLYLASRSREGEREKASRRTSQREIFNGGEDPNFKKNLADGEEIADRVLEVFDRGGLGSGTGPRLAVLELLSHRAAGRLFLSSDKYLPARKPFFTFLEELYREVDARAAMLLGYGGGGTSSAVRDVFSDLLRQEGFTTRLICLYREETSTGFPNPFEVDPEEAWAAYARAFWAVSQGDESEVNLETAEEWAQTHGQTLIPLPLFLSLKSGKEALSLYLSSYPDAVIQDYPDFSSVFDALAREAAFPWFRWSYRITYPLLKTEYRSRGFEAILAAHRIVTQVFGLDRPLQEDEERILAYLESLMSLQLSEEELQIRLTGEEDLPRRVEQIIEDLRNSFLPAQGDFFRISQKEARGFGRRIHGLSATRGDFPREAASLLLGLNDFLAERRLSGEDYLRSRDLVFLRLRELFSLREEELAFSPWLDDLLAGGLISSRERLERGLP